MHRHANGSSLRFQILLDPATQRAQRHHSAVARELPPPAHEDRRWDRLNAIARCKVGLGVGIDLG